MDPHERTFTAGLCRRNALHVLKLAWTTHPDIGFDAAGVRWLHNHIETSYHHLPGEYAEEFVQLMGCFYGECLIGELGGEWHWSGDQLGVRTEPFGSTFPFRAIARQLAQGDDASILTAFTAAIRHRASAA